MTQSTLHWPSIINDLPTGVVIIDANGVIELCNKAASNFLGDSLIGSAWVNVINKCFAPKKDDGHEISLIDGRRVNISISSLSDRAGEMIVINDLTQTRVFEKERARMNRLQEMGEMIAHLAHQVRTPLASAMLYCNNLSHKNLSEEKRSTFLSKIQFCHQNIEQQVRDLLVFAKGGGSLLQTVNMQDFLEGIKKKEEVKLHEAQGELSIDNCVKGLNFLCQGDALGGALCNLIDNALNAKAKKIYLNVSMDRDNLLTFTVVDDGNGMDVETIKQSTRPFYTTHAKGTGLGLAVVEAVVKSHQGDLHILSQLGSGSTVSIVIPLLTEVNSVEMQ